MDTVDTIVIGAGVVGLAVAAQLSKKQANVLIIDKNAAFGEETSSRNSEVIHAGIYYPQNSLKAQFCVDGKHALYDYCRQRNIPFKQTGKLLVAQNPDEEAYLQQILDKATANGVDDLTWQSHGELKKTYPELSSSAALLSPSTGIIDVHTYMQSLLAEVEQNDGFFVARTRMLTAEKTDKGFIVTLDSQGESIRLFCRYLINSAGLHSETVAKNISGMPARHIPRLHWCRGHYFSYSGKSPFDKLIYPVPEQNAVGLGIHATLDMGGQLRFGPDTEYIDELNYAVADNLKPKFIRQIKRYFPNLSSEKLQPAYSGIRPKLQGSQDSFKDFVIQNEDIHGVSGLINLFGIESPGLTASLSIARHVGEQLDLM
ncbi:NAD(P)/FAD-dependent oxidoreductase [Thalassomonas viridans]|uniref:NAD(P)/FAD-dependent oxidoreductase n=1 Tax=Thalassomonas viridans TaxID=137584 RepID=A0AAE9ZAH7_9GAMM|nr:NAD(P)/FAD-dependent oxidoreductase [Thalassomonas viridans]WDE08994.1 NAD(P)/FAD-dependent oxidoreductase [Thalassomonas viridans]